MRRRVGRATLENSSSQSRALKRYPGLSIQRLCRKQSAPLLMVGLPTVHCSLFTVYRLLVSARETAVGLINPR
jgi:hypothetical protein